MEVRSSAVIDGDQFSIHDCPIGQIAQQLHLDQLLTLGKGMQSGAALPPSLPAAALEAVIGALYLDAAQVDRLTGIVRLPPTPAV